MSTFIFLVSCNKEASSVEDEQAFLLPTRDLVSQSISLDVLSKWDKEKYKLAADWSIESEKENEKIVLLTIDDAPDKYALEMAYTLKSLNAPAIFFVNGHFLEDDTHKENLKEIYDLGFMIGNHTYSHHNLTELSEEEQEKEIVKVNEMVEDITGEKPKFFRAPFGENTDFSKQLVATEDMTLMNWTFGYDWENDYMDAKALTDITVNGPLL